MDLNSWLDDTKLVVCVGSGGVGKTTTAASIAVWAAMRGRRVMVLTIDPAKRLANSLGLSEFGNHEMPIDLSPLPAHPDRTPGSLAAMMLDSRHTFDDLIKRASPTPEARDRILGNRVYKTMADTFAGSQDYMATEQLIDLEASGKYDLIVLDTPPVKNALDFMESPGRLINFLDERILKWYVDPLEKKSFTQRLMMGTQLVVMKLLEQIFGEDFLHDMGEFFQDFQVLFAGFKERHAKVLDLFRSPTTGFVTVCAPTESSVDVAVFFQEELQRRELKRGGVVVNQVHACEATTHDATQALEGLARGLKGELPDSVVPSLLARLGMAHRRLAQVHEAELAITEQVRIAARGGGFYQEVPRLEGQVHDLEALHEVGKNLFGRPARTL